MNAPFVPSAAAAAIAAQLDLVDRRDRAISDARALANLLAVAYSDDQRPTAVETERVLDLLSEMPFDAGDDRPRALARVVSCAYSDGTVPVDADTQAVLAVVAGLITSIEALDAQLHVEPGSRA
jgi:hypothetical protein